MHPHSGRGRRRRRFGRKYRSAFFVAFFVVVAVALVGLMMYALTSMSCRMRY